MLFRCTTMAVLFSIHSINFSSRPFYHKFPSYPLIYIYSRTPRTPAAVGVKVLSERKVKPTPALPFVPAVLNMGEKVFTEVVAYPKHLVYAGSSEMSLEELRAVKYIEKRRQRLLKG